MGRLPLLNSDAMMLTSRQRIEPYGWDSEDRTYFVLDDNRVYRLTDAPPEPPKAKKKKSTKAFRAGRRSSKRCRVTLENEDEGDVSMEVQEHEPHGTPDDGLGGQKWECLAVTVEEVRRLLDGFRKSRDENEKTLRRQIEDHLLPILEKQEESRKRKIQQRERELLSLAKMANAKRSSRLAGKEEQKKHEEQAKEELLQQRRAEEAERLEEQARVKREKERDFRMASRGQRLREREARRIQHEEELAQLSEDSRRLDDGSGRSSERRLQAEIEKNKQALKDLEDEDEDWIFDCICGLYGQVDDGTHSVACEECNVWQHSQCLGIRESEAERLDFHFVCGECQKRKQEALNRPKTTIKLKVRPSSSQSQQLHVAEQSPPSQEKSHIVVEVPSKAFAEERGAPVHSTDTQQGLNQRLPASIVQQAPSLAPVARPPPLAPNQHPDEPNGQPADLGNGWKTEQPMVPMKISPKKEASSSQETRAGSGTAGVQQSPMPPSDASLMKTPSSSFGQLHDQHPVSESALSTPAISRDIYRATHLENGNLPAQGGNSPTKHSPQSSFASAANSNGATPAKIPPGITLTPSPQEPILTPPTKHQEPMWPAAPK